MIAETVGSARHQTTQFIVAITHMLCPFDDRFRTSPNQGDAIAIFFLKITFLIEFHGGRDGRRGTDGIQTQFVAPIVRFVDGFEIFDAAVGPVRPDRFVFRTADRLPVHGDDTSASDRTTVAIALFHEIFFF